MCCVTTEINNSNFAGNPDVPDVSTAPPSYMYTPNHCQVVFANLSTNRERNLGVLTAITFNKVEEHTILRITFEVGRSCVVLGGVPVSRCEFIPNMICILQ